MSIASSRLSLTSTIRSSAGGRAPAGAVSMTLGEEEGERAGGSEEMRIAGTAAPLAPLAHASEARVAGVASWNSKVWHDARERCSAATVSLNTSVKVADWWQMDRRKARKSTGVNLRSCAHKHVGVRFPCLWLACGDHSSAGVSCRARTGNRTLKHE